MIPPILFEGDDAGSAPVSGPGQRYALTAVPLVEAAAEGGELPEAYGTRKLWVAARDPHWLYAHWDFSRDQLRAANALARDGHLFLRVHAADGRRESEVSVHPESRHWFLHVGHAGAVYTVELGYTDHAGNWQRLDTAAAVITPPDTLAPVVEAEFESIPVDVPFVDLIAAVRAVVDEHTPLIELLPLLRAQRWPGLPAAAESPSPVEWTPAREEALARVVNVDAVRRVWIGSLEITELVRRKLERDWSSQAAAGALPAGLPGGAGGPGTVAGGLGSPSSPFGGEAAPHQDFWFNVNAELVIYGATEPGASVTLAGRAVALRPDGSFSFRFALPDGQFDLPAVATSADGTDRRSAALRFGRSTTYRGDVGRHPQNPALRSPRAEHLREAQDR